MSSQPQESWAWLGLLKWSLTYVDGTMPSEESPNFKEMSEEDKKFLEEVMKNGIIDEGERMKTILNTLVQYLDGIKEKADEQPKAIPEEDPVSVGSSSTVAAAVASSSSSSCDATSVDDIETLLCELRDIVEQIDYARSFAAMGGIPFLIGCASQVTSVPQSIRAACLAVLATLNQNNPAVQYTMLEQGNIPKLVDLYFSEYLVSGDLSSNASAPATTTTTAVHAAAMQAMSCSVRNHDMAEKIFCMNQEALKMMESALGMYSHSDSTMQQSQQQSQPPLPVPTDALKRKALFFLQALVTSDSSDASRISLFQRAIQYVSHWYMDPNLQSHADIREMALSMLTRILQQKKSVNAILDVKSYLVDLGVKRIQEIRALDEGEEKERIREELELWELFLSLLATAVRDEVNPNRDAELLRLPMKNDDKGDTLPQ